MAFHLNRNSSPILMRNYGRIVQDMITYACTIEDINERESLEVYIAACMSQRNLVWNKDQEAGMARVKEDIIRLSRGVLTCTSSAFEHLMAQPTQLPNGINNKKKRK